MVRIGYVMIMKIMVVTFIVSYIFIIRIFVGDNNLFFKKKIKSLLNMFE